MWGVMGYCLRWCGGVLLWFVWCCCWSVMWVWRSSFGWGFWCWRCCVMCCIGLRVSMGCGWCVLGWCLRFFIMFLWSLIIYWWFICFLCVCLCRLLLCVVLLVLLWCLWCWCFLWCISIFLIWCGFWMCLRVSIWWIFFWLCLWWLCVFGFLVLLFCKKMVWKVFEFFFF